MYDVNKPDEIMEANTDASEWRMEVERVLPQLKVTLRADNKVRGGTTPATGQMKDDRHAVF